MHPDLAALLTLQEKDVAVAEADAAVAAIEPEVRALDDLLAAARRVLEAAQRDIRTALDRRDTLEGKIASYKNMQEQRKQKLEWVRGAKEASTLMAELDLARSVLVKEEAEFMRSGDAVTEAERRAAEAEMGLERVGEAQAAQRADIEIRRAALISGRESAVAARELAAVSVNAALLAKYERIRRGKTPLAIYALHADACGRCFTAVPTQRRAIIQRGGSIEGCEACGVLLYSE
jgi:predicted  nucleic acid-binding Zn-ribbon protein